MPKLSSGSIGLAADTAPSSEALSLQTIGVMRTPFSQKFGIPRQPGLVDAEGCLQFCAPFNDPAALQGIEQVSHVWVVWRFHACPDTPTTQWQKTVRPPRLGGNQRLGVFATRSGFRPNRIGLSVCQVLGVDKSGHLRLSGVDMLDGTPVLDIKPYLPYADAVEGAQMAWASEAPLPLSVSWADGVLPLEMRDVDKRLIMAVLAQDPRPAYQQDKRDYGLELAGYNLRFEVLGSQVVITQLTKL